MMRWLLLFTLLAFPAHAGGEEARAQALFKEIRCMVCAGESIAESSADVAEDIRASVRSMLAEGQGEDSIKALLVSRYGEQILMKPPLARNTMLLWFGPVVALFLMVAIIAAYFSSKRINKV